MDTQTIEVVETATPSKTRMYLLSGLTQDGPKAIGQLTDLVATSGSKVEKSEDLGVKRLAFAINKHQELTLVSVFFQADRPILEALESELKHAETLERYILTDWKADLNAPKRRSHHDEAKKESTQ